MKGALIASIILPLVAVPIHGESRYELSLAQDALVSCAAMAVLIPSIILEGSPDSQAPKSDINRIDQSLMFPYHATSDAVSDAGMFVSLMVPLISVLDRLDEPDTLLTYALMYGEAFLLTLGTKDLIKDVVSRHRPYTYSGPIPEGETDDYFNSFPSGHTSFAFLGATFLTSTFVTDRLERRLAIPVAAGAYTLATAVAVTRILSGSHFVSDVLAGAAIGSFFGFLIPYIHARIDENNNDAG